MDKEAVNKLLSDPNELSKVSIEQLEELVDKHPYFIKLQVLLRTKKELLEANEIYDDNVEGEFSSNDKESYSSLPEDENFEDSEMEENENDDSGEDNDDEFGELEEENSHLPFYDKSFKVNKINNVNTETIEEPKNSTELLKVPEEIVEEDIAYLLKKAGLANSNDADDLTLISFIQPNTQMLLNNSGLYTYRQLKKLDEKDEVNLLAKLTGKPKDQVLSWKEDCIVLFENKYHRLLIKKIG